MGVIFLNGAKLATSFLEMTQCPCKVIVMYENFGVKKKGNRMSIYHIEKQYRHKRNKYKHKRNRRSLQLNRSYARNSKIRRFEGKRASDRGRISENESKFDSSSDSSIPVFVCSILPRLFLSYGSRLHLF